LIKLFISFDTDQNPVFGPFGIKVNYLQYPEVPHVIKVFKFVRQKFFFNIPKRKLRAIAFTGVFSRLFEKRHFQINLAHSQVYRAEKVGKYLLYL
jgi:hypothetical protein